jgi:probable phosphoglycerate mutase
MARIYLARHGSHALVDQLLLGRKDMAGLSRAGFAEARAMAAFLCSANILHVQSSPQRRCLQTAKVIAGLLSAPVRIEPALDEVDFGAWSGRSFADLDRDMRWRRWNSQRTTVRPPGGESAAEVQARILAHLARTRRSLPGQAVVMVTHAEVIRAALLWRLGRTLDAWESVPVAPGSVVSFDAEDERMVS